MMVGFMTIGANAQIAIEESKVLDNTYVGLEVGGTSPLDFNSVFPTNPVAGIKFGKEFTPLLGFEVEGVAIFNDNHWTDVKTSVKGTNLGVNGIVNLSNLIGGYNGEPRAFEFKTNTGLGWLHEWNTSGNALTAKTGLDLQINFGKTLAHSLVVTPAVYWNLNKFGGIRFDKRAAQFGVSATYVYHFKTSNGTHHFKTYDVGAMESEIKRLNEELSKKPKEVIKEVIKEVPAQRPTNVMRQLVPRNVFVFFAQGSDELTDAAKTELDKVQGTVEVTATASPEGTAEFNQELSENRAHRVADYLTAKGVKVESVKGLGVTGDDSGRVAIVTTVRR